MIDKFVKRFMENKDKLEAIFSEKHVDEYSDIVKAVITVISDEDDCETIDPDRICRIDYGDLCGTLLFIIGAVGCSPDKFWSVKVFYGSCSVCDTLLRINANFDEKPTEQEVKDYMTLALHIVQALKEIDGDEV